MELEEAYKQKMAAQLKESSAQIGLMEARIGSASADIKLRHAKELQELRAKQQAAGEQMKKLAQASGDAWQQLKITADKIWDDLKTGVAEAQAKFK